jgi:hypothetical protein
MGAQEAEELPPLLQPLQDELLGLHHPVSPRRRKVIDCAAKLNLPNQVCHGLFLSAEVGPVLGDRVLHVILLLTRTRKRDPTESTGQPTPPVVPGA